MELQNGEYKLSVEKRLTCVETLLDEIRTNHLPHLDAKLNYVLMTMVSLLIGLIIALVKLFV